MLSNKALAAAWILMFGFLSIGFLQPIMAQTPAEDAADSRSSEAVQEPADSSRSLEDRSREELVAQGFVFEDTASAQSRAVGTLLGATAGLVLRGIGHWYVDDYPTAASLLGVHVLSLGLIGTSIALNAMGDASGLADSAMYLGTGLFVLSYAVDVLGTAYSDELGLPNNTREPRRLGLQLRYTYIQDDWHELNHLINGELKGDFQTVFGSLRTVQDVYLDLSSYGGMFGWRAWQGTSRLTWAALELESDFQFWKGTRPQERLEVSVLLGSSLDLGDIFRHLEHFAVGIHIGIGQRYVSYRATAEQSGSGWERSQSYIPMELFTHLNLSESLNARFAYSRWRNYYLHTNEGFTGLSSIEFVYKSADNLDLVFRGELGSGFALSAALNLWLWDR